MRNNVALTGVERYFDDGNLIVSKTDLKGKILYGNKIFIDISGYEEKEIINKPHSILRHPDMPRVVFKLLWNKISKGEEIFAYVVNRCKNGDHYWVLAHVTPTFNEKNEITGYHSNRRVPDKAIIQDKIFPLYKDLSKIENEGNNRKDALEKAVRYLNDQLDSKGLGYDEFIFSLKS